MTIKEFRSKINDSQFKEQFKEFEVTINLTHINFTLSLKGLDSIFTFFKREIKSWEKEVELPIYLNNSKEHFKILMSKILDIFQSTEYNISQKLSTLKSSIENVKTNNRTLVFFNSSSETSFLKKLYLNNPEYLEGAYKYFSGIDVILNNLNLFNGYLAAYEFRSQGNSNIIKRRTSEKIAISNIKNSFQKYVSDRENEISELIAKTEETIDNQNKLINEFIENNQNTYSKWFNETNEDFEDFDIYSKKRLKELEETYKNKLELEAPAKYWKKKSDKYRGDAIKSRNILLVIIAISSVFMACILIISPNWIFENVFNGNSTAIVRWSIVFIALISLLAYTIKAISKVMFSSFHLARDAEERHTLTFFYLALLRDSTVADSDRNLILQSLFSRVDTGLLKDESGPTMPNDFISKLLNK